MRELGGLLGGAAAETLQGLIASASNVQSGVIGTVVGIVTFVVLVTGAIIELQDDLNIIWNVERTRSSGIAEFVRVRLRV